MISCFYPRGFSCLFCPASARVPALLQRGLRRELAVLVVNTNLNFVEVLRALLACCIGVGHRFLRDSRFVACRLLRRTIETVPHRIARVRKLIEMVLFHEM